MAPSKPNKRLKESINPRSRSFGGCATCRVRHTKCDEGRPACLVCQHSGIPCGGYEKNIFFAAEHDDGTERFRRPLFTELERQQMSASLVSSVPVKYTLLNVLSQIDEACERVESHAPNTIDIRRGPFSAFKLTEVHTEVAQTAKAHVEITSIPDSSFVSLFSPSTFTFSPSTQELFDDFVQGFLPGLDNPHPFNMSGGLTEPLISEALDDVDFLQDTDSTPGPIEMDDGTSMQLVRNYTIPCSVSSFSTDCANIIPDSAVMLLKHYSNTVIGLLTPSRHTKTLWHVLFLPHVKSSLAALSMGEKLDHASLCAFHGTLAISAFHLKAASKHQDWYERGCQYKQKAREHVRLALRTAYNTPKVAKYKSILIALLTMVQLSMFNGDWKQTECYLLEAEKFIRLRGLHRQKSRKRRLLHHCYAFMRLLHESLFMMTTHSLQRIHVRLAVESSGLIIAGSDSTSFRLSSWRNLVQKMLEVKSPEQGENDLHLETPGLFSATMYPEIYGLPEDWLVMLSQVIRLGNEKDPQQDGHSQISLKEFTIRAKDLEQCIINWQTPTAGLIHSEQQKSTIDQRVLCPLLDALHQALAIYFYRRIYDIDTSLLQQRVETVHRRLHACDQADPRRIRYTSVFMWPAFIAACESEKQESQDSFTVWFEDCIAQSGQSAFHHMYTIVQQVWHERSHAGIPGASWLDFMKSSNDMQ